MPVDLRTRSPRRDVYPPTCRLRQRLVSSPSMPTPNFCCSRSARNFRISAGLSAELVGAIQLRLAALSGGNPLAPSAPAERRSCQHHFPTYQRYSGLIRRGSIGPMLAGSVAGPPCMRPSTWATEPEPGGAFPAAAMFPEPGRRCPAPCATFPGPNRSCPFAVALPWIAVAALHNTVTKPFAPAAKVQLRCADIEVGFPFS